MRLHPRIRLATFLVASIAIVPNAEAQARPAAPPTRPFLVVANQRSGDAVLVELATGRVSNVDVGGEPHEVAVSPDARVAVLTLLNEGIRRARRVVVLDLATATVARRVEIGDYRGPHGVAFISDSIALIGTLEGTSVLYVDVKNGRVMRSVDGLPESPYVIKLSTNGRAYVSSPHSGKVTELDVASARVTRSFTIPDDASGIAVSADGKELYGAVWRENAGGGIAVFDLEKATVSARLPATQPRRMALTADAKSVVVSDRDHLRIIDRATRQIRSVSLGSNAGGSGVACAPDSSKCYVALSTAAEIVEVDVAAGTVVRRFAAQRGVDGLAYVPK